MIGGYKMYKGEASMKAIITISAHLENREITV